MIITVYLISCKMISVSTLSIFHFSVCHSITAHPLLFAVRILMRIESSRTSLVRKLSFNPFVSYFVKIMDKLQKNYIVTNIKS